MPAEICPGQILPYIKIGGPTRVKWLPLLQLCMEQEPITPTTCDHCGEPFNTSEVHPRRYCSIACEEGRAPLAQSDPSSEGFWLHVQGEPTALIHKSLVANCLKRTCYSPDWHVSPDSYNRNQIVSHDESNEVIVYKTDKYLGEVTDYRNGEYEVRHDNRDGSISHYRWYDSSMVVEQLRTDRWWVDG